jgi:hypothetical protein
MNLCFGYQQTLELLNALRSVQENLPKQLGPTGIVWMGKTYMLQVSVLQEITRRVDGYPIPPTLPLEHLRTKMSQTLVWSQLCFISFFLSYTLIAPAASRAPPLPPPSSRPNRSDEQRSNDPYSSYVAGSARARDQPGSDLTTMGNPPVPQPRHPATQNVNAIPSYMNPWGM